MLFNVLCNSGQQYSVSEYSKGSLHVMHQCGMLALSQNFLICLGFGPQLELKFSATPACSLFLEFGEFIALLYYRN